MAVVWPSASAAYQRSDLRVWWLGHVCRVVLHRAAHLPGTAVGRKAGGLHFLGLDCGDRTGCSHTALGLYQLQGICRAGMADRYPDHGGVGVVRAGVLRHHHQAQNQAHLCVQLVLRCLYPGDRAVAPGEQRRVAGDVHQVLLRLRRGAGRDGAVVVRP